MAPVRKFGESETQLIAGMRGRQGACNKVLRTPILLAGLIVLIIGALLGRVSAPGKNPRTEFANYADGEDEFPLKTLGQDAATLGKDDKEIAKQSMRVLARIEGGTVTFVVKKVIPRLLDDDLGAVPETLISAFLASPTHRLELKISGGQSSVSTITLPESAIKGLRLLVKINLEGHPINGHNVNRMIDLESVAEGG